MNAHTKSELCQATSARFAQSSVRQLEDSAITAQTLHLINCRPMFLSVQCYAWTEF